LCSVVLEYSHAPGGLEPGGGREVREVRVARLAPPDTELHGSGESYLIGSLVRGIGLLGLFTPERPAWSLTELVEHTGLNRTTLYRFLYTLRHLGLLDLDPATRRYRLGPRVLHLGFNYLRGLSLVERALPHLHALRDAVEESAHLGVLDDDAVVYIGCAEAPRIMHAAVSIGSRLPAYATSLGRVLLAYLPAAQQEALLTRLTPQLLTARTIVDREALRAVLAEVRAHGYAITEGEFEVGISSVAAPIWGPSGEVIAALNVTGPSSRLTPAAIAERHLPAVLAAARAISTALGAPPDRTRG